MIPKRVKQMMSDCGRVGFYYFSEIIRVDDEVNYQGLDHIELTKNEVRNSPLSFASIKWGEIKKRRAENLPYAGRIINYYGNKIFIFQSIGNDDVWIDVVGPRKVIDEIRMMYKKHSNRFIGKSDDELLKEHNDLRSYKYQEISTNFFQGIVLHRNEDYDKFDTVMEDYDCDYEIFDSMDSLQKVHKDARKERFLEERYHQIQKRLWEFQTKVGFNLIELWPEIREKKYLIAKLDISGQKLIKEIKFIRMMFLEYDPEYQDYVPKYSYKELWDIWRLIQIDSMKKELEWINSQNIWDKDE